MSAQTIFGGVTQNNAAPALAIETLVKLDGYMAASGYESDHPWRREIGAGLLLSAKVEQREISSLVIRTPFGAMHVDRTDEADHASMRVRQLAALLALMCSADEVDGMLHLAARISAEASAAIHRVLYGCTSTFDKELAAQTSQIAQLLILIQPEKGPDDMLWLAQQLADELADTVASMSAGGGAP